jgi:hypothetical protein
MMSLPSESLWRPGFSPAITPLKKPLMKKLTFVMSFWLVLLMTGAMSRERVIAQSQDPLQEQLNFLKRQLQTHLTHSVGAGESPEIGNASFEAVSFETCRIAWRSSSEIGHSPDLPTAVSDFKMVNHVSVDLSSIDAARTKIYVVEEMKRRKIPWSLVLELSIRPRSPGFKLQMVTTKDGRVTRMPTMEQKNHAFFFHLRERRIVEDVSKTFEEVSNICRSRMQRRR